MKLIQTKIKELEWYLKGYVLSLPYKDDFYYFIKQLEYNGEGGRYIGKYYFFPVTWNEEKELSKYYGSVISSVLREFI